MIALTDLVTQKTISEETLVKVVIAQRYIEDKYNRNITRQFEREMIQDKVNKMFPNQNERNIVAAKIREIIPRKYYQLKSPMSFNDYDIIKQIGKGCLGEIWLCKDKKTNEIVAIKKINKMIIKKVHQEKHILDEQFFLQNVSSKWIVELKKSFEEGNYLYLVMEFLSGGDLMSQLIIKNIFKENEAKFYLAELILAIEDVHINGGLHRDIKPENILIDQSGHIKLCDFGLIKIVDDSMMKKKCFIINNINDKDDDVQCKSKYHHKKAYSRVGTPLYIAPEIIINKTDGYESSIDLWAAGVIFYEMLFGHNPFFSKREQDLYNQIKNFKKFLVIPKNTSVSYEAKDLILKMVSSSQDRLSIDEIKRHDFFKDIDWKNIRKMKADAIPIFESTFNINEFSKSISNQHTKDLPISSKQFLCYNYDKKDQDNSTLLRVLDLINQCKDNRNELLLDKEKRVFSMKLKRRVETRQSNCLTMELINTKFLDEMNRQNTKIATNKHIIISLADKTVEKK